MNLWIVSRKEDNFLSVKEEKKEKIFKLDNLMQKT